MIYVVIALFVLMMVMSVVSSKKNKKRQAEMLNQVVVGAEVMTIGGIIGKIVAMDNAKNTITILTGNTEIIFTARAVHSVISSPVAPAVIEQPEEKTEEEQIEENK